MSGIGFWELILLFLIGLIVLGPERLPRVANQLGSWLGQARRMTRVMRRQLEEELDLERQLHPDPPAAVKPKNANHDTPSPPRIAGGPDGGDDGDIRAGGSPHSEEPARAAESAEALASPAKTGAAKEMP